MHFCKFHRQILLYFHYLYIRVTVRSISDNRNDISNGSFPTGYSGSKSLTDQESPADLPDMFLS